MTTGNEKDYLKKLPHVSRRLAGEVMLFAIDGRHELPIRLNDSGSRLWDRLETSEFPGAFSDDERVLIDSLIDHGLVEISPAPGTTSTPTPPPAASSRPTYLQESPFTSTSEIWEILRTFDVGLEPPTEPVRLVEVSQRAESTVPEFIELVERRGAIGQLAHAIDNGFIETDQDSRHTIQERWAANQLHCLRIERLLVQAARILDDAAIEFRVLKGVAVAHLDYPDPSYREFGDVDVLVRRADFLTSVEVLTMSNVGLEQLLTGKHPFEKKGTTLITSTRLMVDIHHHLALGGLGTRDAGVLFDSPEPMNIGGRQMFALSIAGRLVHAGVHRFTSKGIREGTIRDFTELRGAEADQVRSLASSLRYTAALQNEFIGLGGRYRDLANTMTPTHLERVLGYKNPEVAYNHNIVWRELTGFLLTPGIRTRIGYVRSRLVLSPAFRNQRSVSWRTYATELAKPISLRLRRGRAGPEKREPTEPRR